MEIPLIQQNLLRPILPQYKVCVNDEFIVIYKKSFFGFTYLMNIERSEWDYKTLID